MSKAIYFLVFLLLGVTSTNLTHASVDCTGKITMLGLSLNNGIITLGLEGGPGAVYMCSVKTGAGINGIDPGVCKVLYSSLLAAKASGKKATIRFQDHDSCTTDALNWNYAGSLSWSMQLVD